MAILAMAKLTTLEAEALNISYLYIIKHKMAKEII